MQSVEKVSIDVYCKNYGFISHHITGKGQTTIPKAIRDRLNLKTGDRVEIVVEKDGRVVLVPATIHVAELKGIMLRPKKVTSLK